MYTNKSRLLYNMIRSHTQYTVQLPIPPPGGAHPIYSVIMHPLIPHPHPFTPPPRTQILDDNAPLPSVLGGTLHHPFTPPPPIQILGDNAPPKTSLDQSGWNDDSRGGLDGGHCSVTSVRTLALR